MGKSMFKEASGAPGPGSVKLEPHAEPKMNTHSRLTPGKQRVSGTVVSVLIYSPSN
jgi:hypothetical protein